MASIGPACVRVVVRRRLVPAAAAGALLALSLALVWLLTASPARGAAPEENPEAADSLAAHRDSLLAEMTHYHARIAALRDSLLRARSEGELDRHGKEMLDRAMEELGVAIGEIGRELGELQFDIGDQRISVRDRDGGGIEINIPDDLGERISNGLASITTAILDELPDTLSLPPAPDKGHVQVLVPRPPRPPRPARKLRGGDIVRLGEDVYVRPDEEVRGQVVAIFADVLIQGRVTGNVVTIFGDAQLDEGAEVGGEVVVLGRLDQSEGSEVGGDVVVVGGPLVPRGAGGLGTVLKRGWVRFLAGQVGFVLVGLLVLLIVAVTPRSRLEATVDTLAGSPGASFGVGLGVLVVGHLVLLGLAAVLVLTVIGIPLAILLLLGWALVSALAIASSAVQTGRLLCRSGRSCDRPLLLAFVGVVVLHALSFLGALLGLFHSLTPLAILIGALGLGVELLAWILGLGALALSRLGGRERRGRLTGPLPDGSESPA